MTFSSAYNFQYCWEPSRFYVTIRWPLILRVYRHRVPSLQWTSQTPINRSRRKVSILKRTLLLVEHLQVLLLGRLHQLSTFQVCLDSLLLRYDAPFTEILQLLLDGGLKAWATVAGAWLILFCTFGYINAFGVYEQYYQSFYIPTKSSSDIAWIGSFQLFLMFGMSTLTGKVSWLPKCLSSLAVFVG